MTGMTDDEERERVRAIREGLSHQEIRRMTAEVRAILEYVRHVDIKLDILQGDIDELVTSLRLSERLSEVEASLERERIMIETLRRDD